MSGPARGVRTNAHSYRYCRGFPAMGIPTVIALRNCFITVANRDLMLPEPDQAAGEPCQAPRRDRGLRRRLDHGAASRRRPSASPSLKRWLTLCFM